RLGGAKRDADGLDEQRAGQERAAGGAVQRLELGVVAEAAAGQVDRVDLGLNGVDRLAQRGRVGDDQVGGGAERPPGRGGRAHEEPPEVATDCWLVEAGAVAAAEPEEDEDVEPEDAEDPEDVDDDPLAVEPDVPVEAGVEAVPVVAELFVAAVW